LTRPSLKYRRVGTSVSPFSRTIPYSESISRRCASSFRGRSGSWAPLVPRSYGEMCRPTSQSSPSRTSAYACASVARPSRRDFTSVPVSTMPVSTRSSRWYSCRARRFSAISFSPVFRAMAPILGTELDLAGRPVDGADGHPDRIAEAVGAVAPAADERRAQLGQLEVVALQRAHRDVALVDVAEAHKEA